MVERGDVTQIPTKLNSEQGTDAQGGMSEYVLGKIASAASIGIDRTGRVAKHLRTGAMHTLVDIKNDARKTFDIVLHDTQIKPTVELTSSEEYQNDLHLLEETIKMRIPLYKKELPITDADFDAESCDEREEYAYSYINRTKVFYDGLAWIEEASREENPGPHVDQDQERWLSGRLDDFAQVLIDGSLHPQTASFVVLGLNAHYRKIEEHRQQEQEATSISGES